MKLQIVSDLHLEHGGISIPNSGSDVLILSGDICVADDLDSEIPDFNPYSSGSIESLRTRAHRHVLYKNFFQEVSDNFAQVVYVAGNHEFYQGKWTKTLSILRDFCSKFPNIQFLENDCYKLNDVIFVGGTLWTDLNKRDPLTVNAISGMMNDYNLIRNDDRKYAKLSSQDTVIRHTKTLNYIKGIVDSHPSYKVVVVGHHSPCPLSISDTYKDEFLLNGAYASDLSEFILDRPQIKLWTHGHLHNPSDYMLGETRIICNPRGYKGEESEIFFDATKIVEI